jgi:hypothetical protein
MDVQTDGIDWELISRKIAARKKNAEKTDKGKTRNRWPVKGVLRLRSDYFKYKAFTWRPFYADLGLKPGEMDFTLREAKLCGVATPGEMHITPDEVGFHFQTTIENEPLKDAVTCLTEQTWRAGGNFDLNGNYTARGKPRELTKGLKGSMEFTARDGRITRFGMLAKILEMMNIAQILRMKLPDLETEGFAYREIRAKANIQNGRLILKEANLDSAAMQIACNGSIDLTTRDTNLLILVAPLQTGNIIVKHIPLVNYILGGTLVTIPLRATGDIFDPEVTAMSPKDVGANLVGIMERTLKAPFRVVQPETFESVKTAQENMIKKIEKIEPSQPVPEVTRKRPHDEN